MKALEELPRTLHGFYDRILDTVKPEDQDYAFRALQWMAYAARPLRLAEVAEAMIIGVDKVPYFDPGERFSNDKEDVLQILTSGLVTVVESVAYSDTRLDDKSRLRNQPFIQFAHLSVKEYLTSGKNASLKHYVDKIAAKENIARSCSAYLLYVDQNYVHHIEKTIRDSHARIPNIGPVWSQLQYPLLGYASRVSSFDTESLRSQALFADTFQPAKNLLQIDYIAWRFWVDAQPMSYHQSHWTIKQSSAIDIRRTYEACRGIHPQAWLYACGSGHILSKCSREVTTNASSLAQDEAKKRNEIRRNDEIMKHKAHISLRDHVQSYSHTVHQEPPSKGAKKTFRDRGPARDIRKVRVKTRLDHGMQRGYCCISHASIYDLLRAGSGRFSLLKAPSEYEYDNVLQKVLEAGAHVDAMDDEKQTALYLASTKGWYSRCLMLLDHGADPNLVDEVSHSPLISTKDLRIVDLLLNRGADPNFQIHSISWMNENFSLWNSSRRDSFNVLDSVIRGVWTWRPEASHEAHERVSLLLAAGANITIFYELAGSALRTAVKGGMLGVAKILLYAGDAQKLDMKEWSTIMATSRQDDQRVHDREASRLKIATLLEKYIKRIGISDTIDLGVPMYPRQERQRGPQQRLFGQRPVIPLKSDASNGPPTQLALSSGPPTGRGRGRGRGGFYDDHRPAGRSPSPPTIWNRRAQPSATPPPQVPAFRCTHQESLFGTPNCAQKYQFDAGLTSVYYRCKICDDDDFLICQGCFDKQYINSNIHRQMAKCSIVDGKVIEIASLVPWETGL